jgi:carbon storage regulator
MLVLSRKAHESIVIDGRIVVTVAQVKGETVRLAFEAPQEVVIHRSEVQQRIAEKAASTSPSVA